MLKNQFKLAFRHLWRDRGYTALNLVGLALGLGSCIVILVYAHFHLSYDRQSEISDRIHRVLTIDKALGVSSNLVGITMPPAGPAALDGIPEVEAFCRVLPQGENLLRYGDRQFYAENFVYADSNFFDFFGFTLTQGDPSRILRAPDEIVISRKLADKLFPGENPVGQQIQDDGGEDRSVVGVFADLPPNSHLQIDCINSMVIAPEDSSTQQFLTSWQIVAVPTYLRLTPNGKSEEVTRKFNEIAKGNDIEENFSFTLQSLHEAHLHSTNILFDTHNIGKSDFGQIRNMIFVAVFILLVAAFNFMNLSTARSARRAREVGVRKVIGSTRTQIVSQFLFETILLVFISWFVALVLVELLSGFLGISVPGGYIDYFFNEPQLVTWTLVGLVGLGALSGIYPAFVLSAYRPIQTLKGNFSTNHGGVWLRRVLVSFQFAVSIVVLIGMIVVRDQLNFMDNKDLGFSKDYLVTVPMNSAEAVANANSLKDVVVSGKGIQKVAFASTLPGTGFGRTGVTPTGEGSEEDWIFSIFSVTESFAEVMQLEVLEGRFFSEEHPSDLEKAAVINESAAEAFGWENPVGRTFDWIGPDTNVQVIGVIKNFHYVGMRHPIEPVVIRLMPQNAGTMVVKLDADNVQSGLEHIEKSWKEVNPNYPFDYEFFDDEFRQIYSDDKQFSQVLMSFNGLAILIACLGLLGLTAFTVQQKTKEIGVRKVLGARMSQIMWLLSKEFLWILMVAVLLALPLAYYLTSSWLSEFVYRIDLGFQPFFWSILAVIAVSGITIWSQSVRAMRIDTAKTLKMD